MIEFSKKVGGQVEFNALIEKIYPKSNVYGRTLLNQVFSLQ